MPFFKMAFAVIILCAQFREFIMEKEAAIKSTMILVETGIVRQH